MTTGRQSTQGAAHRYAVRRHYRLLLCLLALLAPSCRPAMGDAVYYQVVQGNVLRIDILERSATRVGRLHRTAPDVVPAGERTIWGRADWSSLVALDPRNGRAVRHVKLPHRPYKQAVAGGKLYVAHNTLTDRGFSISVVDTRAGTVLSRIRDIGGLITGFASHRRTLYVTALGVKRPDNLYLYEIDSRSDIAIELLRTQATGFHWAVAAQDNRLYLTRVSGVSGAATPRIDVLALPEAHVVDHWDLPQTKRVAHPLLLDGQAACVVVVRDDHTPAVLVLDMQTGSIRNHVVLPELPSAVVGLHRDVLAYLTPQSDRPGSLPVLRFLDLSNPGEPVSIDLTNTINEETTK